MLIQCTIKRVNGSTYHDKSGKPYLFAPNEKGDHVCDVEDPAAIKLFLGIDAFLPYGADGATPIAAGKSETDASQETMIITNGDDIIDLMKLDKDALLALGNEQLEMGLDKRKGAATLRAEIYAVMQ